MSNTAIDITTATSPTIINNNNNNHQNEQHAAVASNTNEETEMKTENVDDGRQNQRDGEKGERERREDNIKRTPTMREQKRKRVRQINTNTNSVTSSTNEQHTCPSVNDSMINRVLSSFNSSLSNNHSSRSTNTIASNPPTLHYISSPNSHPMPDRFREYESSYPSISRYGTSLAYRATHYLDDSDEEIINDEILEIIHLDHYPTLIERWGDDTRTIIRQEGQFKIEDYVEFDEIEPTIVEDIVYEMNCTDDGIATYREIHRTRSESRNFRKIRKRRTKCKRQTKTNVKTTPNIIEIDNRASELLNEMHNLSDKINLIIQTGENFNDHIDEDLSGDDCEITTHANVITKRLNEINNSDRSSNIDISSQSSLSDKQQEDFSEKTVLSESQLQSKASKTIPEHEEVQLIETQEQDLQLFLNSLLGHLIPQSRDESTSNVYSSDQIEIEFHEKTPVDIHDATFQTAIALELRNTTDEQTSSDSLTKVARQIRPISRMADLPSIDSRVEIGQSTDTKEDELLEPCEITFASQTKEDKKSSTDSPFKNIFTTQRHDAHENVSVQKPSFDLQITESASPSTDKEEHLSSNALPEDAGEISTTPIPIDYTSDNINKEIIRPIDQEIVELTQQIKNILPHSNTEENMVQHTFENKEQSNSNVFSSPIEQTFKEENVEDISVPSNSLTSPVTVHLPIAEVNPEEASSLPAETDKQLEIISTPEEDLSQKTYTSEGASTTISDDRQSPILLTTIEDENVVLSSDSLPDTIRQILSTTLPVHHPSVDHTSITNEQASTIISSSKPTAHIEDNELLQSNKTLSITETNPLTKVMSEIPTTSIEALTTLVSEDIKDKSLHNADQECNSSSTINHIDTEVIPDVHDILRQSIFTQSSPAESDNIRTESPNQDYFKFEQIWPDFTLTDEKNRIPDLSKSYYELQDQRRIQSILNYEQIEKKQEPSGISLHNQPQHLGLESFSLISNLPSREYRQVFGAPDKVISKVEDLTTHVASNSDQQSNKKPIMIEALEDYSSIVTHSDQVFINEEKTSEDKSNSYIELDSRYSTLIDRINSLIQPLLTYSSIIDNPSIPSEIQNKEDDDQRHLRERYDVLIDHVRRLEEANHANLTESQDSLVETTEQRLNTPLRVVTGSYEKTSDELNNLKGDEAQTAKSQNEQTTSISSDLPSIESTVMSNPPPAEEKHSSSIIDYTTSVVNNVLSNVTSALTEASSTKTNKEIITSKPSRDEEEQHQPLTTGLFEIMKNLLSKASTITSSDDNETISSSETIPTLKSPKENIPNPPSDNMIHSDDCQPSVEESSSVISKPIVITSITDINTDHKNEETIGDGDKEHHGLVDFVVRAASTVKETIANITSSNSKSTSLDESNDNTEQPTISNNFVESAKKVILDTYEKIVPTQNQSTSSGGRQTQTTTSGYPWYTNQYKVADTEFDRLSSTQQSLANDESEKTTLPQQLQVIGDNYPWYSSYYTIVDAEAKMYRINRQSSLVTEQTPPPATFKFEHDRVATSDDDHQALTDTSNIPENGEDKVQAVQHQERLSTSAINEKSPPATTITATSTFSSDINLEPVNSQEHSDEPSIINKKKHKKKKTNRKAIVLFDASIPSSSPTNEQKIETVQPETLSTLIESNTEELKQKDNTKNESLSSDTSPLLSSSISTVPQNIKVNTQPIEQPVTPLSSTGHSSPSSVMVSSKEEDKDDEGFQLVHSRKRIPSASKSENLLSSSATTSKQIRNSDVDLEPQEKHENQDSLASTVDVSQSTTSKKTKRRHKKHKKERISSSDTDWNNGTDAQQPPTEQETILQSQNPSSSIIDNSNLQSKSILTSTSKTMKIPTKASVSTDEEEDNEGFQVVRHRKRINSGPKSQKPSPSSSARTTYKQNLSHNTDLKTVTYGRYGPISQSIPRTATGTQTPPKRSKQTSWSNIPARSASTDTQSISSFTPNNNFEKPKANRQLSKDTERETIPDVQYKLDQSASVNESTQQIVKENPVPANNEIKIASSAVVADTLKLTLIEDDDDDGFRVVRHHKHMPSSPTSKQSSLSLTIDRNSASSSAKDSSSTSTTSSTSVILPSIPTKKKSKNDKEETLTSEPTQSTTILSSISPLENEITHQKPITDPEQVLPSPVIMEDSTLETAIPQMNESVQRKDDIPSPSSQIKEVITKKSNEVISIKLAAHIEDEQIKTSSSKQAVQRRKKKSKTNQLLSPTSLSKENSHQLISNTPIAAQSKIKTTELSTSDAKHSPDVLSALSSHLDQSHDETNNKLDIFLPEYIRQHINPTKVNPSSTKKKQRPKMLTKDIEAKSLLTNEFDDIVNTKEEYETISNHAESIDDDDEFIIQRTDPSKNELIHSDLPKKPDETIDNILSRGFYLWLQESQILSQSKDKPLVNRNSTHTMQSLIIQPVESNDEDDSGDKPTYMTGIRTEKRIHNASAYSINHPESLVASPWLTAQSRDLSRFDSDHEDSMNDPSRKHHSHSVTTRSSANTERQASSIISSVEPTDSINKPINFDDWAHFVEEKNSCHTFLSTCFYARTFDEDTLISDAIPIYQYKKQRYGDFLLSSDKPESTINQEEYISRPSDSFQRWQRQKSTSVEYENDDEIFLSHSNNGLSRRVRP